MNRKTTSKQIVPGVYGSVSNIWSVNETVDGEVFGIHLVVTVILVILIVVLKVILNGVIVILVVILMAFVVIPIDNWRDSLISERITTPTTFIISAIGVFIGSCYLAIAFNIPVFILLLKCLFLLLFLLLSPFVIRNCILICNLEVDGVIFVGVGCGGDTVGGIRFLFEHITEGGTNGFQRGLATDMSSVCQRIFDGWGPTSE